VSLDQLTFDNCIFPNASIERAIQRLNALASATSTKRPTRECDDAEGSLIAGLVARSKTGDSDAMEFLIERYQPRIAGFVFVCVGEGQAVDDLCQTIFYKMLVGLPRLETDGKFESWLFRIARNACFDYLRKRRLRRIFVPWNSDYNQFASATESTPESAREPTREPTDDRRLEGFRRALMMLPKRQRELIALLQDDRLSYQQLAAITNSSVKSVKSRLFRARRQLRKLMHDDV
jgi:RNA polymerase sigma-70 factor, ECF subfamily